MRRDQPIPPGRETFTEYTHTRAVVEFHSDFNPNGEMIAIGSEFGADGNIGHLIGVQTHKGFDGASGTFSVIIKKTSVLLTSILDQWDDVEDIWVKIFFILEGQTFHVMTGLVDTINETMTRVEGGRRVESYTITGRDVGKVLETTELWLNIYDIGDRAPRSIAQYFNALIEKNAPQGAHPDGWIRYLLELWVGNNGLAEHQWQLPSSLGSNSFWDTLDRSNIEVMDDGNGTMFDATIFNPDLEAGFGKLWEALMSYSNDLLNEFWIDLETSDNNADLRPSIYLRERPFPTRRSKQKWQSIKTHFLEKRDVQTRNVSKGGSANRYNYWMIKIDGEIGMDERALIQQGAIDAADQGHPGRIPVYNTDSIARHGLRRWERSSRYLSGLLFESDGATQNVAQLAANWLRRIHDWYSIAPMQLSGQINLTRPFPEIRMGHRIVERRDTGLYEYYCEGVDHAWRYPGAGKTTLTVTRGQRTDRDLLKIIYEQIENPKILKIRDCVIESTGDDDIVEAILQGCKFAVVTGDETGFDIDPFAAPEVPTLEDAAQAASGLLAEGGDLLAPDAEPSNPEMIPPKDTENAQARELVTNPNARLRRPPNLDFDEEALDRQEDPLAGFDDASLGTDPLAGLEL